MTRRALELDRDPAAAARARAWLSDTLMEAHALEPPVLSDLMVMASELVTNVIDHTGTKPRVAVTCTEEEVLVEVSDDHPGDPEVQDLEPGRVGGNGLRIVDAWSRRWGVERHGGKGKTVWFTVPIAPT